MIYLYLPYVLTIYSIYYIATIYWHRELIQVNICKILITFIILKYEP